MPATKPLPVSLIQSPPFWLPSAGLAPVTTKLQEAVSATHVLEQQVPPSHVLPQTPQFFGSLVGSTHFPAQSVWGVVHVGGPDSTLASLPPGPPSKAE
jgi:hypothetical protein